MAHDFDTLLRLHPRGEGVFESEPLAPGHLFGGYSLALAVRAAARTVPSGPRLSSLQAVFPSPGDSGRPLRLQVGVVRDGRSSALRQVTAVQEAGTPLHLTASFHTDADGSDWQPVQPLPDPPEQIAPDRSLLPAMDPVEFRPAGRYRVDSSRDVMVPVHPYWARPRAPLPDDDAALHAAVVAFVSDYMVVSAAQPSDRRLAPGTRVASLNHSLWLHRPVDAGDWLLYSADPARISGDRRLVRGSVRTRDGQIVASFAQEVLTVAPRG